MTQKRTFLRNKDSNIFWGECCKIRKNLRNKDGMASLTIIPVCKNNGSLKSNGKLIYVILAVKPFAK